MAREIKAYYELFTSDDLAGEDVCEASERGEAFTLECEPDAYDLEDGKSAVDLAFDALQDHGPFEPSSWPGFDEGIWYSDTDGRANYRTGDQTYYSYHPQGFSEDEQRELWARLTAK